MSDRFFQNQFPEYDGTTQLLDSEKQISGKINEDIQAFIATYLHQLKNVFRQGKFDVHDTSVYTGTSGIALLAQKVFASNNAEWRGMCSFYDTLLSKMSLERRSFTFMCGDAGPLVVQILNCVDKGDEDMGKQYADELLKYSSWSAQKQDNEILYGRAGYLYALLVVQQLCKEWIADSFIEAIVTDIINKGVAGSAEKKKSALPLYYKWYGEEYVGAAHGYVGIFYMILQAKIISPQTVSAEQEKLVINSLDALLNIRFPSGNLPPVVGETNDKLVHFCHGAPGAIHLYALAYKLYKNPAYLAACHSFADVIWTRGLLKRGYGTCHGVAGNGYALLCMYQVTGELSWLWRALKFAEWCLSYGEHGCRTPDTPYSLFEGLAGTLYFLIDVLMPEGAKFPAFQLVGYS